MTVSIIIVALFWMACVVALCGWVCYLIATAGRPKPPRRLPPAPAPAPPVVRAVPPAVKTSPTYIRRWGSYRRNSVAAEKAAWLEKYNATLSGASED